MTTSRGNPVLFQKQIKLVGPDTIAYEQIDTSKRGRTTGGLPTARGMQALAYWPGDGRVMLTISIAVFVKKHHHWYFERAVSKKGGQLSASGAEFDLALDKKPNKAESKFLLEMLRDVGGVKAIRKPLPARVTRHP